MSKAEHTPGPWKYLDKLGLSKGGHRRYAVSTDAGAPKQAGICEMDTKSVNVDDETREANAAFIVRACNSHAALVEALQRLMEVIHDRVDEGECLYFESPNTCSDIKEACPLCFARAALHAAGKGE